MTEQVSVVVFDVNETLSDLAPMAQRFADVGAPQRLARLWFTMLLRDGFALTAAGASEGFGVLAEGALRVVLADIDLDRPVDAAVRHVLDGFAALHVHPDVVDGVRQLRAAGLRLVTLSNGSVQVAERLLTAAGIRDEFEALLSVDDAGAWKPARAAYDYAGSRCGVGLGHLLLVAVHPWDIDGAARAGMATAWVNRASAPYPGYFTPPTITARTLGGVAATLDRATR